MKRKATARRKFFKIHDWYLKYIKNIYVCVCVCVCVLVDQPCLTPGNPTDCGPPGSSVHRILQAGIVEWVAISYSRGSSQPRGRTCVSGIPCIGRWILYDWEAIWEATQCNAIQY